MSHSNAIEAIKEPCKVFNISLEEGFAESLLEKLSPGSTDVELTYLQVFLDRILKLADPENPTFSITLLSKVGNISDLLGGFLDEQIALMDDPDLAMTILKSFVSGKGTKRPASVSETKDNVKSLGREISPEFVTNLIQSFVRLRVLRDKDDQGRYELRHDSLAEKIFEKFSLAEKELIELKQFIENAYQSYLKRQILLSNDDLIYISNKDSLLNLNPELKGFLLASRKHQQAKIRTVRRLTVISALVFVLLIGILAYFVSNKIKVVTANYDAVKSFSQTKSLKEKLTFSVSAWGKSQSVLPKEALLNAFNNILLSEKQDSTLKININRFKLSFEPSPVPIQYAECSKDNKYIFGHGDSLILIWKSTGELYKKIKSDHPIIDIKISADSKYIGAVNSDSLLTVWDISGKFMFSYKIRYNKLNTKQIFKFIKENNVLTLSKDHDAVLLNYEGGILQTFDRHKDIVNAIDISSDNNFIATASSDKTIIIWYFNSVKKRYDYYNTLTWHRDTVWSVSFSKFKISVITASADSTLKAGNINNEVSDFSYFPADRKYCYAELSKTNKGILAIGYNYKNKELNKTFLASHVGNPTYRQYLVNGAMVHGLEGIDFDSFVYSPNENYFIYEQNNKTYLVDTKLVFESDRLSISDLMELNGSKHFFTSDGKYIIAIEGNTFRTYFVDVKDIYESCIKQGE